jgi:cytochrome oxidase assembly protein ShyY1
MSKPQGRMKSKRSNDKILGLVFLALIWTLSLGFWNLRDFPESERLSG